MRTTLGSSRSLMSAPDIPDQTDPDIVQNLSQDFGSKAVTVQVSWDPPDAPSWTRRFKSLGDATEFINSCHPDPKAFGSPKQAALKRAKFLRVPPEFLRDHQVLTTILQEAAPKSAAPKVNVRQLVEEESAHDSAPGPALGGLQPSSEARPSNRTSLPDRSPVLDPSSPDFIDRILSGSED